jgi:16S rRNA C967 or C1407 C5-methylase (RsmB/RsmF family)/NOL1/NOP2/fmu family ribosome biogenesis protein
LTSYLPSELISSLSRLDHFDPDAFERLHSSAEQIISVHMNPLKPVLVKDHWLPVLSEPPFEIAGRVPWAPDAYYLSSRPSFTLDPLFHAGCYYVQEASGMFAAYALQKVMDLSKKIRVLDLCAAPGGKSTLIQSLISEDSLLLSNEVIKTRVPVLYQNLTKWGFANGVISSNDPVHFKQLPGFFDVVIVDAPCSGSGLFRKDPLAARKWSPDGVRLCSQRQQRILSDAWDCLKEGGFLIYSTCSFSKEENEDILDDVFRRQSCISVPLNPDPGWNIIETLSDDASAFGYRFYPYKLMGEGFFLSIIQKKGKAPEIPGNETAFRNYKTDRNVIRIPKSSEQQLSKWIKDGSVHYLPVGESIHALPKDLVHDFENLKNVLYLKKAGIRLGKTGETQWIPDHELSLSNILKEGSPSLELTKRDALSFLRGEPFETDLREKGWWVVRYGGKRLGWVKILDKRMNNYYPKSWRIRL